MHVHGARVAEVVKPPHLIKQLIPGKHPVGRRRQMVQKLQLLGRGIHPPAVHKQLVGIKIDGQLVKDELFLSPPPSPNLRSTAWMRASTSFISNGFVM